MSYKIENIITDKGFALKLLQYSDTSFEKIDLTILTPEEKSSYSLFKSDKRKLEFYYTRLLWQEFKSEQSIQYTNHGRPFIKNGHISISHSRDIIIIGLNTDFDIGIDVEYYSPKISSIQHKFISAEDEKLTNLIDALNLTLIWSIKEAVYKMENIPGLSFKDNIHVKISGNLGYVDVIKNNEAHHYTFKYIQRQHYVITYCSFDNWHGKTAQ